MDGTVKDDPTGKELRKELRIEISVAKRLWCLAMWRERMKMTGSSMLSILKQKAEWHRVD